MYKLEKRNGQECVIFWDDNDSLADMNEWIINLKQIDDFASRFGVVREHDFDSFLQEIDIACMNYFESDDNKVVIDSFPARFPVDYDKLRSGLIMFMEGNSE